MQDEDRELWRWKGEMFADGDWRDRAIAVNTKTNIVRECVEGFRHTLQAVLGGYDGMTELRDAHRKINFWLRMMGYWAIGATEAHRRSGRLNADLPPWLNHAPPEEIDSVPLINARWMAE